MFVALVCTTCGFGFETEVVDGVEWRFTVTDGKASVGGGPGQSYAFFEEVDDVVIPAALGGYPVVAINQEAFFGLWFSSILFPPTLTRIGFSAFKGGGMESIAIPGTVREVGEDAFDDCYRLRNLKFGEGVQTIGVGAFGDCRSLTSVTIPASVKLIDSKAFEDCESLARIDFAGNAPKVGKDAFSCVDKDCTAYVRRNSTGWGVRIPGRWNGIKIAYEDESSASLAPVWQKSRKITKSFMKGDRPVAVVQLKVGRANSRTGVVKVSGSYIGLNGKKIALKAVEKRLVVSFGKVHLSLTGKGLGVFNVVVSENDAEGWLGDGHFAKAIVGGGLVSGNPRVRFASLDIGVPGEIVELMPASGEPFTVQNGVWRFAKAASVKYAKRRGTNPAEYALTVDTDNGRTNLSALKLSYRPKTGLFKGSCKVYAYQDVRGQKRIKKHSVKITGLVVDGVGYGIATPKRFTTSVSVEIY